MTHWNRRHRMGVSGLLTPFLALCLASASAQDKGPGSPEAGEGGKSLMMITSTAFAEGRPIPREFTCDGKDMSPPLSWQGAPDSTRSYALISDDPDAPMGTWVHWVLYNVPPDTTSLPAGFPKDASLADGSRQGISDFGRSGYGGPCPPKGKAHRYFFKLYALDTKLELKEKVTKKDLEAAMKGHILAEAQIVGTYERK